MYFLDNPYNFHVDSQVDDYGNVRFLDTTRLVRFGLKESIPQFEQLEHAFAPGHVDIGAEYWRLVARSPARAASIYTAELTFQGAALTEKLNGLMSLGDPEPAQLTENNTRAATLYLSLCESSSVELYVPYSAQDGTVRSAGLHLKLSHGSVVGLRTFAGERMARPAQS